MMCLVDTSRHCKRFPRRPFGVSFNCFGFSPRGETRGRKARTNLDILDAGVGFQGAMCAQLREMEHFLLEQISEVPSRLNGGH